MNKLNITSLKLVFLSLLIACFILACEGGSSVKPPVSEGGNSSENIIDKENSISLIGTVDSSYISLINYNKIFMYEGEISSDNIISSEDLPIKVSDINQNSQSLIWEYNIDDLSYGTYTAFVVNTTNTSLSGIDSNSNITKTVIITADSAISTIDILRENIIRVGPNQTFRTPSAAYPYISDGDVVEIDAGVYENDIMVWHQNNITLRGVNGRAHLKASNLIEYSGSNDQENGKAIWVIQGNNVTVENIEFSDATVPDNNGAGIRQEGEDLFISNCYFHDNENGILGGGGITLVEYSEFSNNGYGDGYTHNMYIGNTTTKFIFRYSNSHHAHIGHNLKSRAAENHILYSRLMDEVDGNSSYGIDLPNGGKAYIIGNIIQQSPYTDNSTIVSYGAEGLIYPENQMLVFNNTVVNNRSTGTFVRVANTVTADLTNNLFIGNGTVVNGSAIETTNLHITTDPGLSNIAEFDYTLTATATAVIDQGTNIETTYLPTSQYNGNSRKEIRPIDGKIDIGAYEF